MSTSSTEVVHDDSITSPRVEPPAGAERPSEMAVPDPEAGLSSIDAFVLCALILAAVAAAAGPISAAIQGVGNTISGLIP